MVFGCFHPFDRWIARWKINGIFSWKKKTMGFPPECLEELILQEQNSTLNPRLSVLCVMCVFARALLFNLGCSAIYRSSCITNHRNAQQPLQRWFNSLRYLLLKFLYTNTHTLAWHTESLKLWNTMTFSYIDNSQSATNHRSVAPWKHISDLSWYN